jgi:hypothetical protein
VIKEIRKKKKNAKGWSSLTDLRPTSGVALCHWLDGITSSRNGTVAMQSSQSRGHDGSPFLSLCNAGWIDIADVRALSPFVVSEALRDLYGKKDEAPGPPHSIPDVGSERLLRFSSMV